MKKYIFVLRNRESRHVYLSSNLYEDYDFQYHMVHLDSIGVDVIGIIRVEIDLSEYE